MKKLIFLRLYLPPPLRLRKNIYQMYWGVLQIINLSKIPKGKMFNDFSGLFQILSITT